MKVTWIRIPLMKTVIIRTERRTDKDEESIEDAFGGSGDEDSEDQEEEGSEEDENPFIKYFTEQGLFR